jgi:hypothetical protein
MSEFNVQKYAIICMRLAAECRGLAADVHEPDLRAPVCQGLISISLNGNTEAAFSAELVTAVSTEIGMGIGPVSICWHTVNSNPDSRCRTQSSAF